MRLIICDTKFDLHEWAAKYIVKRIKDFNPDRNNYFTMGLAPGDTPLGIYRKLIEYNKAGKVSFKYVKTFNQIEYVGLPRDYPNSYHTKTYKNFANHVDIDPDNVYELNGNASDLVAECEDYEKMIKEAGGIELSLAGIGFDGHVAFDEPGSSLVSRTRLKTLAQATLVEHSVFFENDVSKVPKKVLTVGIGTLMDAAEVMIVANGLSKAIALQKVVEEGVNHMWTASAFQQHPRTIFLCDEDATAELRVKTRSYFKNLSDDYSKWIEKSFASFF